MDAAAKIKRLRGNRAYAELAEAVGCSRSSMFSYATETKIPFSVGIRLARVLGVPAEWLADDEQDWPPPPTEKQAATAMIERMLAGAGLVGELNEEERDLLVRFRALNDVSKGRMLGLAEGLNASNASPPDLDPDLAEGSPSGRKYRKHER